MPLDCLPAPRVGRRRSRRRQWAIEGSDAPARPARWYINRNFALLWTGQGISLLGDLVFDTTLVLWVATSVARGESWAPLAVSGVLFAALLPSMVVGPFAGVFVDRWDRRRTMLAMDVFRALLLLLLLIATRAISLPFLSGDHSPRLWTLAWIYAIVAATAACSTFANPSSFALLGTIVDSSQRTTAAARLEVQNSMAIVLGPPLAALIFGAGVEWALLLNAASFAVSFGATRAIRVDAVTPAQKAEQISGFASEMAEGLRFFVRSPILVTISVSTLAAVIAGSALNTLTVFFVVQNLHAPARLYGGLYAALGAGSVVGALTTTIVVGKLGSIRTFWTSLVLIAMLLVVCSRLTSFPLAVVMFFLFGVPNAAISIALGPLLFQVVQPQLMGRISALLNPLLSLGRLVGAILSGFLASAVLVGRQFHVLGQTFGPIDTIFVASGLLCLLAGLYTAWRLHEVPALIAHPIEGT